VDLLAREHVTSARNAALVALCQDARLGASGVRVIEALASGLPRVAAELAEAHLPPARFFDAGIRFTVLLEPASAARTQHSASAAAQVDESDPQLASLRPGTNQARVLAALRAAPPLTIKELAERTGTPGPSIRRALTQLRERGLVHAAGGRGQTTTYRPAIEGTTVSGVEDVSP
jgi:ATP-dependent DNA helicase RecG